MLPILFNAKPGGKAIPRVTATLIEPCAEGTAWSLARAPYFLAPARIASLFGATLRCVVIIHVMTLALTCFLRALSNAIRK